MISKDDKKRFEETGKEIISLLEQEGTVFPIEMDADWRELQRKTSRSKRKRILYRISYSAAAVVCLVLLSTYILFDLPLPAGTASDMPFTDNPVDNVKEVVLLTEGQNIVLENESEVEYNEEGKALVKDQFVSSTPEPTEKKAAKPQMNEIIVPNGKRSYVLLSDGSRLSINSGSRVAYPVVFEKDKREIFVQGEVYLQVAKNTVSPFYVKTGKFDVRVLGTSFNVSAYKEDSEASVVLVEGAVEMITNRKETVKITPGQKLTIGNEGLSVAEVDVNEYILWKDNILYLGNYKSCAEILTRLSRRYDVHIEYDNELENIHIGGKLDVCEKIEDVLDILSVSAKFGYKRQGDHIIIKQNQSQSND